MLHKFKVEPIENSSILARVIIDDNEVKCKGYMISHSVDEVPTVEIELCAIPQYEHDVVVQVSNKEEIARLMDYNEFNEFCAIWNEVHKCE